jgi:hypothetical protein
MGLWGNTKTSGTPKLYARSIVQSPFHRLYRLYRLYKLYRLYRFYRFHRLHFTRFIG